MKTYSMRLLPGLAFLILTATLSAAEPAVELHKTKAGTEFATWGPLPDQPEPTLFILAGTMESTLGSPYFRQCGNQLAEAGYLLISVDIPCHGKQHRPPEPTGLSGWAYRCEQGDDFVADNNRRLSQVLDELIADGRTNPDYVGVCGTSRGGYLALQFAAHDPRVKGVAAFAPVTDLTVLNEFKSRSENKMVQSLSMIRNAEKLAGRPVWIVIGDRDVRVGTDEAIAVARSITQAGLKQGGPSQVDLHVIAEPKGHTVPKGSTDVAAKWFLKQVGTPDSSPAK
ncbi:esterase [Gimesia maris]|uniref:alpha/beta hydrolase family protein n=1 Tax=Gimesia maris TaxID=122 RepID=UPI0011895AFE|nr:prolyl oligopeptidase family serine peptidase [Gimesia maris]QDU16253.1 esterase [Gimesia maris]